MKQLPLIIALLTVGCGDSAKINLPTEKVERMDFNVVVETIGSLDAARSTVVSSVIGGDKGTIIWLVDEGKRVEVGDQLVKLDPTPFADAVMQAKTLLAETKAIAASFEQSLGWERIQSQRQIATAEFDLRVSQLDLLKFEKGDGPLEISRLESAAEEAEQSHNQFVGYLQDLETLMEDGIISENDVEQARKKSIQSSKLLHMARQQFEIYRDFVYPSTLEKAKGKVARAELELEQIRKSSTFQIGKAKSAMDQAFQRVEDAQSNVDQATEELNATTIHAPIPGMVVYREEYRGGERRKPRVGDAVWQNQPLLYLPDISSMVVNTFIREVDVHKISIGTATTSRVDAFPKIAMVGTVSSIGVLAENSTVGRDGAKVFQLTIKLEESDENLRPGMTARSTILAGEIEDAICVPVASVFIDNAEAYCYVEKSGGFVKTAVVLGSQNESVIEIRSGLEVGQRVSLVAP